MLHLLNCYYAKLLMRVYEANNIKSYADGDYLLHRLY